MGMGNRFATNCVICGDRLAIDAGVIIKPNSGRARYRHVDRLTCERQGFAYAAIPLTADNAADFDDPLYGFEGEN